MRFFSCQRIIININKKWRIKVKLMERIINHIVKKRHNGVRFASLFVFFFTFSSVAIPSLLYSSPTHAYSASLNTSSSVVLNTDPNHTTVHTESINVVSDCQAGYNLTISTSGNNKLYKNGDPSITAGIFNPVSIGYALNDKVNNANTWGYSLVNEPGTIGAFNPITTTPAFLRTEEQTRTEAPTIDDTFNLYYGVNIAPDTPAGSYRMANNGTIIYQLTMAESCNDNLEITFLANAGSDQVTNLPTNADNTLDPTTHSLILSTKRPARSGYIFKEWNTSDDGTGSHFQPGDSIKIGAGGMSGLVDLYAIWTAECASGYICYDGNGADEGTMPNQEATNGNSVTLIASNFSRANYGFAGWNTMPDGSGTQYGPNQNITMPSSGGLNLFARWIEPTGTLQAWANPSSLNVGDVIALKDSRDNEVYTVAKLADNNVWITENLRLIPNEVEITANNTHNPTADFLTKYPSSSSSTGQCYDDNSTCVDQVNFNAHNLDRTLTPAYNGATNNTYWYSYGVMYNWYTATAGNGTYSMTTGNAAGDLCPAGWHLPTGGSSGEWGVLASNMTGGSAAAKAVTIRAYPNNFLWSGDYNPSKDIPDGVGKQGRLWSTTPVSSNIKNAYRMGYNSAEITATTNSWNKWDNFAIRCIYQGGNIPFVNTNVVFSGSGITSVTFTNPNYGTETATSSDPTVNLAENATYTITAVLDSGYELTSWATTSTGTLGSTTDNPTTYTITDESTLTATGALIPSYSTTVTLPEHVTSITFSHPEYPTQTVTTSGDTVTLKKNVSYTITASYEEGYTLDNWTSSAGGTFGDDTAATTTYTVTSDTTMSLTTKEAELLTYTLHYDAGSGSGTPADDTKTSYHDPYIFTIDTSSIPTIYGSHFVGYSETQGATTATYVYDSTNRTFTPSTITVASTGTTTTKTLYAVYQADTCPANRICYFGSGADAGTMSNQTVSDTTISLIPPNYSKSGYGFAGWLADPGDPSQSIPETIYGPGETITPGDLSSSGLKLYAKWIASAGNLQSWNGCNSLSQGSVTALTDTRDNQTYAVAKLADGNCWLIENLRLDPTTATNPISSTNTHNPTASFITAVTAAQGQSLSTNTMCNTNDSGCFDQIQYNANSLNRSLTPSHTTESSTVYWYSYGVYYNWYTATAGNGTYSSTETSGINEDGVAAGDLCPINWHLPTGGPNGEYKLLNDAINNGATGADNNWRAYPNNFIRSGDFNTNKRTKGNVNGRIWTATAKDNDSTYRIGFDKSSITPSANVYYKWDGFIMRCMRDESTAEYSDVTVTFPTGVDSITFTSAKYGEQTATPQNPIVQLAEEATYTLTANESMGYEFSSWSAGQGTTIGDQSENPTTITITGDTTLSVTAQVRPSYQVDVTIDEGVTSLGIYNATYGTQTFTPATMTDNLDGTYTGTATLYKNIEYTITGTLSTGYQFNTWTTGTNGTLGDATSLTTTYTVTGTSTLTLNSQLLQPPTTCNNPVPNITYMQDINDNNYNTIMASLTTDAAYYLRDSRDGEPYCVSKLQDGNLWLLDNLRLNLTDSTVLANTTTSNTNASATSLDYLKNGGGTSSDKYAITGVVEWTDSSSYASSYSYSDPLIATSGDCDTSSYGTGGGYCANDPSSGKWTKDSIPRYNNSERRYGKGSGKIGIYYNFCAASAGSYCYGNGSSTSGSPIGNNNEDICPINWRMPIGHDGHSEIGEYNELCKIFADSSSCVWSNDMSASSTSSFQYNLSTPLSGSFVNGLAIGQGRSGSFWSSTLEDDNSHSLMSEANVTASWSDTRDSYRLRYYGISIRCMLDQPDYTVTVSLDSHVSSVAFEYNGETQTATSTNPTVSLKQGKSYTITATPATGYEFSSWSTTSSGTLGSTTTNPTTYTVTDEATLSVSSQVAPSYTVIVNMDSNVSSVGFYNADLGTQTATSSSNTVTLYRNVPYTVIGSYNQGYEFASWSTTGNGTLTDATAATTIYAITGTATLSVTSQILQPPTTCNTPVPNITYMQDITTSNKTTVLSSLTEDAPYYIRDNRDEEPYCVSKLKDGNLWMLNNLRLDLTNSTILNGLTTSNTHVNDASLTSLKSGNRSAGAQYASSGFVTWDSSSSSNVYNQAKANADYKDTTTTSYGSGSGKIGVYYNYCAASAGSYCYNEGAGTDNAQYDLCPAGWRMPTGDSSGEYQALYTAYSSNVTNFLNALSTPLSGRFNIGSANYQGSYGYFWTSTYYDGNYMYFLNVNSSNVYPASINNRNYGYSLRCLLDPTQSTPSHTVTVNLDSNVTGVSFTSPLYGTQNVTTSGSITLYENTPYTITATTATGYEFISWSTGANGTLGSTTTNPTTYAITDATTLTITSQLFQPPTSCNTPVPNITYMQEINNGNYSTVMASLTPDSAYYLRDSRDNEPYCVSKLQDGNLWLLDNLRLDLSDSTVLNNVTASNTNASATSLNYLKNGGGTTSDRYATAGVTSNWYNDLYSTPLINASYKNATITSYGDGSGKVGVYYNYCTASAGSYCYGSNYTGGTSVGNATEDLCPANWRMPTGNTGGEYQVLYTTYNSSNFKNALSTPLSGNSGNNGSTLNQNSYGSFWSSTRYSDSSMYVLKVRSDYVSPTDYSNRSFGYSLRCLASPAKETYTVTVSFDSNITSISFANPDYGIQNVSTNGGTVTLYEDTPYIITATTNNGYALSSWTSGTNGSLDSLSTNPTTYTITGNTTLSATSEAVQGYSVTVNMDNGINSVGFYNANYGTQTATPNNNTVTLYRNILYTVTGSYKKNYEFVSWTTDVNGNLDSTSSPTTIYSILGSSSITLTTQLVPPPSSCNIPVPNITYMQDITASNKSTVLSSLTTNKAYYIRDSRDNEPYCVSKLQDGNLWLLDNLRLDPTDSYVISNLSSQTTNATDTSINSLLNGGGTDSDQYAIDSVRIWRGIFGTKTYKDIPMVTTEFKDTKVTSYGNGSGKVGNYYNYCAASAGSYCYSSTNPSIDATEDLCPIGWRMPTGGNNGEYKALCTIINGSTCSNGTSIDSYSTNSIHYRLSLSLSGQNSEAYGADQNNTGYLWASTRYNNNIEMDAAVFSGLSFSQGWELRQYGYAMRCLLD